MLDLEDQLRRYGEVLEQHLESGQGETDVVVFAVRRRSRFVVAALGALVVVVAMVAVVGDRLNDDRAVVSSTPTSVPVGRAGVFSTPTNTVLLFSDGIDGATAIDLDRRVAGRRVIDGERAGDQSFRLTLTRDQLVVGWGEIFAAPLAGGRSTRIADATVYIPASEPGEVWTITWRGGRIGAGSATLRRVRVDGTVTFTARDFDASALEPIIGVPGGLAVDTPQGVAVWNAASATASRVLGPGPATAATSDGRSFAWCESTCANVHVADLDRTGPPTAPHVSPGSQQVALSADGKYLAILRPADGRAELIVTDRATGRDDIVAQDLDPTGALQWHRHGRQLFYTENSYREPSTRIGRYDLASDRWELQRVPVGDGLAALALDRAQAHSFFSQRLSEASDCRGANGSYPSGRRGVCTFAFSTPDSPDQCVAHGTRKIIVPDAEGHPLSEAIIVMQQAGLNVVGTGTPNGDPSGPDAIVESQEPGPGTRVPQGACIGFRTSA